jgi:hypothetical protein
LLGVLLCTVAVGSPRALMDIIKVPPICTTALITPAHSNGHDKSQSNDANDDHDYDDSCPYCHWDHQRLAHFGVLFQGIVRRGR